MESKEIVEFLKNNQSRYFKKIYKEYKETGEISRFHKRAVEEAIKYKINSKQTGNINNFKVGQKYQIFGKILAYKYNTQFAVVDDYDYGIIYVRIDYRKIARFIPSKTVLFTEGTVNGTSYNAVFFSKIKTVVTAVM